MQLVSGVLVQRLGARHQVQVVHAQTGNVGLQGLELAQELLTSKNTQGTIALQHGQVVTHAAAFVNKERILTFPSSENSRTFLGIEVSITPATALTHRLRPRPRKNPRKA
jgi:hypothetical protein